jgi:hypothetical protein
VYVADTLSLNLDDLPVIGRGLGTGGAIVRQRQCAEQAQTDEPQSHQIWKRHQGASQRRGGSNPSSLIVAAAFSIPRIDRKMSTQL